jgi:hypothetical protein
LRARWPAALLVAVALAGCGDDASNAGGHGGSGTGAPVTTSVATAPSTTAPPTTVAPSGPTTVVVTTPPGTNLGRPTLASSSSVSTAGLDRVLFGMTLQNAERAAGSRLLPDTSFAFGADCAVLRPESGPDGIVFTISKGTIERVDIVAPGKNRTRSGAGIGTPVTQLRSLFGDRLSTPDPARPTMFVYTPVDAADAVYRVVFETDGTTVTSFRAGRVPQVNATAPC